MSREERYTERGGVERRRIIEASLSENFTPENGPHRLCSLYTSPKAQNTVINLYRRPSLLPGTSTSSSCLKRSGARGQHLPELSATIHGKTCLLVPFNATNRREDNTATTMEREGIKGVVLKEKEGEEEGGFLVRRSRLRR